VKSVAQWVGRAENGADTFGPHYSEIEVELGQVSGAEQRRILGEIRRRLGGDGDESPGYAGLQFGVNTFLTERIGETVSGVPAEVVVNLYGEQLDALDADARAVAGLLLATPGARDVQVLAPPGAPELSIRLRPERLARHGLTAVEVMEAVQAAYGGAEVGQVWRDGLATPLVLVLPPALREDPRQVGALPLRTGLTLADVADLDLVQGRSKILRDGARRVQVVTANLQRGHDPEAFVARLERQLRAEVKLSPGVHAEVIGSARAQATARAELIRVALLSAVGVAALLLLAFRSARHLAIVFVNLPFALVGGVAAVLATGGVLSIGTMVGFVTLFGITLRNSIMMVSHYQHLVEDEGHDWHLATAVQGALERLPSILMTALVTGLALAPLALGSAEPGREIEGPMATIIVGGLVSSTLLNLLVLPTVLLRYGRFAPRPAVIG
jgi:Cu/Ag efflux pump CusA